MFVKVLILRNAPERRVQKERLALRLYMELNLFSVIGKDHRSLRVFLEHALKPDQIHTRRTWAESGPWTERASQTGPRPSRSRTGRVRIGQSRSLPGPSSTGLDRSRAHEGRSRTGRLRVGRSRREFHTRQTVRRTKD
jgi:hypothetical protein